MGIDGIRRGSRHHLAMRYLARRNGVTLERCLLRWLAFFHVGSGRPEDGIGMGWG
jgi:hypothetical protein